MADYRFILEQYTSPASRDTCPACRYKKVFTHYIDAWTGERLPDEFGRCDREEKCGYHLNPYTEKYIPVINKNVESVHIVGVAKTYTKKNLPAVFKTATLSTLPTFLSQIPKKTFEHSLNFYEGNHFVKYLIKIFGSTIAYDLLKKYKIGTSKYWTGSTVFWQIDADEKIRSGKIMLYNEQTGKRIKNPFNHISWVHRALKIEGFLLQQCFFGEHLLTEDLSKPVAIVESEKTAIITNVYLPQFIWLAAGSKDGLNNETKCAVLKNRQVVLWPDVNAYNLWKEKAYQFGFEISDFLEKSASDEQRQNGWDLADYLVKCDSSGLAMTDYNYPVIWDYK